MKTVGVREFRDHATRYLGGDEPVAVERRGERIGLYVPIRTTTCTSVRESVQRLEDVLAEIYAETGLTEDEFADLLDPSKPFPLDDPNHPTTKKLEARAARR